MAAGDRRQQAGVDVAAGEHGDGRAVLGGLDLRRQQRGHADRSRPLDDELAALEQQRHRLGGRVLADDDHSSSSSVRIGSVIPPGRLTAMPSAIVSADVASIGSPACIDSGNGAHAAAWTPMICTSGLASLIASATPAHSPPPPTGITTLRQVGHVLEQLEPERALAGDDRRVVERVHERQPAALGALQRARPRRRRRSCRRRGRSRPARARPRPWTSARRWGRRPRTGCRARPAAAASAWAWLPALAATTPSAQPSSPSAASLAATPRTLNEPVRCRFSAFSATVPPARSENVRVESIGVRRATVSTAARAARTSRAVTLTAR